MKTWIGLLVGILWSNWLGAQAKECAYTLWIQTPNGPPRGEVYVHVHETHAYFKADEKGRITLTNFKAGTYHLHIFGEQYKQEAKTVFFRCGMPADTLILQPSIHHIQEFTLEESLLKIRESESTLKIELIDPDYLRKHGGQTFLNQIDDLPGVNVINTGTGIAKPIIRGFGFNRVAVVDKGIRQEGQQWGWDHGLEMDQFDIERAEVIKGPSALIYGSDAVGGVIGIRIPEIPPPNSFSVEALTAYRSVNDLAAQSAGVKTRIGRWLIRARLSQQSFSDYRVPTDSFDYNGYRLAILNRRLKNTAGREQNASATIGYMFKEGFTMLTFSTVNQQAGFFAGAYGLPTAYNLALDGDARNIDFPSQVIRHHKIIWNTNLRLGKGWLEADFGWQWNKRRELSFPSAHGGFFPKEPTTTEHDFQLHTLSWNVRYHFGKPEQIQWIIGSNGQVQDNRVAGFAYLLPNYQAWQQGLWLMGKKSLGKKVQAMAGVRIDAAQQRVSRFEQIRYDISGSAIDTVIQTQGFGKTYVNWSASAGLTYQYSERSLLRWNLASSFRLPTIPELAANGVHHGTFRHEKGDSNLLPERGFHLDMVYDHHRRNWSFSVAPFVYFFVRFIFLQPTGTFSPLPEAGQLYQYTQATTLQTGLEAALDYHFTEDFQGKIWGEYVATYNFDDGYPLPFIPPAAGGVEIEWHPHKLHKHLQHPFIRLFSRMAAPQMFTARNERTTPGYVIAGLSTGITFEGKGWSLDLTAELQNLLNTPYFVHVNRYRLLNIPEPGRNINLTAVFRLHGHYPKKTSVPSLN